MNTASVTEGWIASDGLRLRYVSWGRDDAPVVVMLHGLRSHAHTWADVADALTDRYRVVALDQRGRGSSDWDPRRDYHAAAYVRDLDALVRALGLRRFVLAGHSMGGANAFVYASRQPVRLAGLVIEDRLAARRRWHRGRAARRDTGATGASVAAGAEPARADAAAARRRLGFPVRGSRGRNGRGQCGHRAGRYPGRDALRARRSARGVQPRIARMARSSRRSGLARGSLSE